MKLQKIAVVGLFVLGFAGISAGTAQADDVYPNGIIIDCASGYEAVYNADNTSGTCEPIATAYSEDIGAYSDNPLDQQLDENGCAQILNADGETTSYVCARSAVPTLTSAEPIVPASGCVTVDGTEATDTDPCVMAYSSLPADATDSSGDVVTDDSQIAESGVPILMSRDVKFKSSGMASEGSSNESNLLAAFGVLVAAAGAFGIGLSNQRAAKK